MQKPKTNHMNNQQHINEMSSLSQEELLEKFQKQDSTIQSLWKVPTRAKQEWIPQVRRFLLKQDGKVVEIYIRNFWFQMHLPYLV